ncbi:sensor histidine kinase [uncultured Dokdonia sp.]|uniref:sensor histidine kinase n=1 Tax=uncultured Dokdonia sp. TaxID=575653 RepID=UPI00262B390C|nr:sensor histidine kinase [uncultured Dokdonia sp.]
MLKKIVYLFLFLCTATGYSQHIDTPIDSFFYNVKRIEFKEASKSLKKTPVLIQDELQLILEIIKDNGQTHKNEFQLEFIEQQNISSLEKALRNLTEGLYILHYQKNRVAAFEYFRKAYEESLNQNSIEFQKYCLISILNFYLKGTLQNDNEFTIYLEKFKEVSTDNIDHILRNSYWFNLVAQTEIYNPERYEHQNLFDGIFKEQDILVNQIPIKAPIKVYYYLDKGNFLIRKEPKESLKLFEQLLITSDTTKFYRPWKYLAYINSGRSQERMGNYREALLNLEKSQPFKNRNDSLKNEVAYHSYAADYYSLLNKYDSAYYHARNARYLGYQFNFQKHNTEVSKIKVALDTAEKEKENLILTAEKKRNQNIALSLGGSLAAVSIIAFLVYRNTKRKQRIAEQDRELQIQKTEKVLKEKELETINAMVSGQEKERLRLASELHDNLGSTLATVRMQVENLERNLDKVDDPKALLQKTNALVNEAYTKVRSISHERNSGVLAKDGLLPAIKKLARTVSSNNNLQVDVQDFGLENRIANELEITIFRIIQELVTNIIKHANASEANISLTQHDNELNIMVEDNGKGFKARTLQEKDGMGLGSIERRIEHLEGTMEVDSAIGRGTSVSIDIPL